jgi:hypothetical protein
MPSFSPPSHVSEKLINNWYVMAERQGQTLGQYRHGRGIHKSKNGDTYDGDWHFDQREGKGRMVMANGLEYEGEWKEDKAHGQASLATCI